MSDHKIVIHDKTKNIKCHICDKAFSLKKQANAHIKKVHQPPGTTNVTKKSPKKKSLIKKYKCDFCDYATARASRLKVHRNSIHIKKILYECGICKYSTYRKDALTTHIRVVHEKIRPQQCHMCDMTFTYKRDKAKHLMKNHGVSKKKAEMDY